MKPIFEETRYGAIHAKNRIVMAPMSRNRATYDGVPTPMMATYYAQRANAGLIVAEGMQPDVIGQGFMNSPGIHNEAQIAGWQQVTEAVHREGGKIVAQLMHAGRIGHPALYPSAHQSVAPSAIAADGQAFTPEGPVNFPTPRAMTEEDIALTIQGFAQAAKNAIEAGFDGVEIHAGNGFLLHQFMASNTNQREDAYGGSIENRIRFTLEVTHAVTEAIGAERTGIRLSPSNPYNDIVEVDTPELYRALLTQLPTLAFIHIMEACDRESTTLIRELTSSPLILNPHQTPESGVVTGKIAEQVLQAKLCDGVAIGALFLANPDLMHRLKVGGPFNELDPNTLYGGDQRGYTDYPTLEDILETA
ncbi:alkene reductase [Vibrio sp. TRT 17S01]|uniref:alkene reductase n=1 Tax=Vibrio sp. TRT 17S01 TaxID=3418505 RepID=UPI003CF2D99E